MSTLRDPLLEVEAMAIAMEATSADRHDVRNKLGVVTNSAYYIRRRVESTDLFTADSRIGTFFGLIDTALAELASRAGYVGGEAAVARQRVPVDIHDAVDLALETNRARREGVTLAADVLRASIIGDPREVALAVRALVENAVEASSPGQRVRVSSRCSEASLLVEVEDEGSRAAPGTHEAFLRRFFTTKPGRLGLGVNIATRIAGRYGGSLSYEHRAARTAAVLSFPRGES